MEKKSQAQQKLEARRKIAEGFSKVRVNKNLIDTEKNPRARDIKKEIDIIDHEKNKIEPYTMPNLSKGERSKVIASATSSVVKRDVFGRKLPKESEHTEAYYIKLQNQEESLVQQLERGLEACEEDGYDIVAIEELEGEMAQIVREARKSKIYATEISIKQLSELETKLERLVDEHEQGLKR